MNSRKMFHCTMVGRVWSWRTSPYSHKAQRAAVLHANHVVVEEVVQSHFVVVFMVHRYQSLKN